MRYGVQAIASPQPHVDAFPRWQDEKAAVGQAAETHERRAIFDLAPADVGHAVLTGEPTYPSGCFRKRAGAHNRHSFMPEN
ncbi:MAG: hypothetical protein WA902_08480 [Thermosynechococcaceae cyanobacterium]